MKAVRCEQFGPPSQLELVDLPSPEPGPDQVLIDVAAAGVGFVDGLLVQGLYQVKPPLPYWPGSEFSGRISKVGRNVPTSRVGERVMGLGNGTFAEQTVLNADRCITIPERLSDQIAAGFVINYATALYGLRDCGNLQENETLLVLGASGGVGSAAIAVAKAMGVRVIAAASSQAKIDAALNYGADQGINYTDPNWRDELKAMTATSGLDAVYDPVGGQVAEPALRSLAPGGRYLVVGFASGTIPAVPFNLALLKRCSIVGVDWGGEARADAALTPTLIATLLDWIEASVLHPCPVISRPLSEVQAALTEQLQGQLIGKLVFDCQP